MRSTIENGALAPPGVPVHAHPHHTDFHLPHIEPVERVVRRLVKRKERKAAVFAVSIGPLKLPRFLVNEPWVAGMRQQIRDPERVVTVGECANGIRVPVELGKRSIESRRREGPAGLRSAK